MAAGGGQPFLNVLRFCYQRFPAPVSQQKPAIKPGEGDEEGRRRGEAVTVLGQGQDSGLGCREIPSCTGRSSAHLQGFSDLMLEPKIMPLTEGTFGKAKTRTLDMLPSEILRNILSYLDVSSLLCVGQVNKLFHLLANDNLLWGDIFKSEFESCMWKPKIGEAWREGRSPCGSAHYWKRRFLRKMWELDANRWTKALKDVSAVTGMPLQTEHVLRSLSVSWELVVSDRWARKIRCHPSHVFLFQSSVIVQWSGADLPQFLDIRSMELHGFRKETPHRRRWTSLMFRLDVEAASYQDYGCSRTIQLKRLSRGFLVGVWRGQSSVAFVLGSLHVHRLVERSLLGSPVSPYAEPLCPSEPESGPLHYSLHLVLHNTAAHIGSGHFGRLSPHGAHVQDGLLELRVIQQFNPHQHQLLPGSLRMAWQSGSLQGAVENCCFMTLILSDEGGRPVWCVSEPVLFVRTFQRCSSDYGGQCFQMEHSSDGGRVRMTLVRLGSGHHFLVDLTLYVSVCH